MISMCWKRANVLLDADYDELNTYVSEIKLEQQVGYNFGGLKLNQVDDPSGSAFKVNIKDNSFMPSTLTVPVGATVEWHNQDGVQHTVTSDQGLFDSGVLMPGKKFAFKFNAPGSFGYHCGIHSGMQGTITVKGTAVLQGSQSSGSEMTGSKGAGSASWSEKPLSLSGQTMSAGLQSETQGMTRANSFQLQSNPAIDQSAGQLLGQASSQAPSQTSSQVALQKFSQYYRSTSETPEDQFTAPTKIDLKEVEPAMLYFGSTQKAVPYAQYQTYALSTGTNSLWIS